MQSFQSILVDVDSTAATHPALERALALSRQSGARLKIVDVVSFPSIGVRHFTASMRELVLTSRREQLMRLAASIDSPRLEADILVGRPATVLVKEVLRTGHDLLMRSRVQDTASSTLRMYDSVDMELFRQCPCPVWAESPMSAGEAPRILAAVNASPEDAPAQELNKKIIELALLMTELQHGSLTIFQAWTAVGESMLRTHITADELAEYLDRTQREVTDDLRALTRSFGANLQSTRIELKEGAPEVVIPQYVASEGVHQVVMGSIARTGLSAYLIGNTAERLLQRLACSVITVKPDDFVSPVRL